MKGVGITAGWTCRRLIRKVKGHAEDIRVRVISSPELRTHYYVDLVGAVSSCASLAPNKIRQNFPRQNIVMGPSISNSSIDAALYRILMTRESWDIDSMILCCRKKI